MSTLLRCGKSHAATQLLKTMKLQSVQNAFEIPDFMPYEEVVKQATLLKEKSKDEPNSRDQIVFIDKAIKSFNMKEVKNLIELDTQYSDVKFKLLTDNTELKESSINPNIRRLLNNGLYYGIYMNSPQQSEKYLRSLEGESIDGDNEHKIDKVLKQVYLSESINSLRGTNKFIEFANHQVFKIPFELNGKNYDFETPAISIISKIQAIGVPSNHPDLNDLLSLEKIDNPFVKNGLLPIIEMEEESESSSLIALIPKHILAHQKYISTPFKARPGPVTYEGKEHTYSQLSTILANQFNIRPSMFEIVPFIMEKPQLDEKEFTKTINNIEVLNRDAFPIIRSVEDTTIQLWKNRSVSTPLNVIPSTYVAKCIDFKKTFDRKRRSQNKVDINSDILRSVILRNDITSNYLFFDTSSTMKILNSFFQVYLKFYNFANEETKWDMNSLLQEENFHDYALLRQFHRLTQGEIQLGDFGVTLVDYIITDQEFRTPQNDKLISNPLLFNVVLRILKDQVSYQFPEFSNYYLTNLNLKETQLTKPQNDDILNKWQNFITYPIISLPFNISASQPTNGIFDNILPIISQLYTYSALPAPYTHKFLIRSAPQFSISSNLELINKASKKITGFDILLNEPSPGSGRLFVDKELYKDESSVISSVFQVWAFKDPEAWVSRLKPMQFLEKNPKLFENGEVDIELFKEKFKLFLFIDIHDNISVVLREQDSMKENDILVKLNKLENYITHFAKSIDESFIRMFKAEYDEYQIAVEGMDEIEDVDAKINEFKEII